MHSVSETLTASEGPVCLVSGSPWGDIVVRGDEQSIRSVRFQAGQVERQVGLASWSERCRQQLQAYCKGQLTAFDLPLQPRGTAFQQRVWQALQTIPFGELRSYQQQAEAMGSPGAVRAVASANARNPISIIIPCHRVIGSDAALRGYAGGLAAKVGLLRHEGHQLEAGPVTASSKVLVIASTAVDVTDQRVVQTKLAL